MMKTYLKRAFQLSDSGVKGLAKSIWSFFLYYVSFVPPMICVFLFADRLLNGNTGKPVVYLLFMLAATLVMYLVINYNYKTTYDETYQESATLRIDLAEQLSKLPLSYFSKHNLSDLAQTIMADVASIEHAFANAVANSIGFAIYFLVISVALLIMNWKLGLCVLLPVLTSASVLFLTKKLQVRDVNKHYDKLVRVLVHIAVQLGIAGQTRILPRPIGNDHSGADKLGDRPIPIRTFFAAIRAVTTGETEQGHKLGSSSSQRLYCAEELLYGHPAAGHNDGARGRCELQPFRILELGQLQNCIGNADIVLRGVFHKIHGGTLL